MGYTLLDVLSLADFLQCTHTKVALLKHVHNNIQYADFFLSLAFLQTASVHAAAPEWGDLLAASTTKVAETCAGDLDSLLPCSFDVVSRVLACDELNVAGREGRILVFVVKWGQTHDCVEFIKLLKSVRFPFLRLSALEPDEKEAMRYLKEHAGKQLGRLLGEAVRLQSGQKRVREGSSEAVQTRAVRLQSGQKRVRECSSEAVQTRAKKRKGSGNIPTLSQAECTKTFIELL